jgi:membrane protease subunit HflC
MSKTTKIVPVLLALAIGLFFFRTSAYKVSEWEQAIITQFGRPIGDPVTKAGLHFKLPFIQEVRRLDKRILNWDGYPNQIPTKDKKYIWVDTTARWRIKDPLLFIQSVRDENGARSRLDGVLDSVTRDVISNNNLVEAVRNSNTLYDDVQKQEELDKQSDHELSPEEEEVIGEIEKVEVGREQLSARIIEKARAGLAEFGIEIIDVQLRRIAYEKSVEAKVFERMISERMRIAEKIRSFGQGERAKITGKIQKDLAKIQSEAYRQAETVLGKADATAIQIYAGSMNADPKFYEFVRTLEAYKKALPKDTKLILSTDNKFLDILRRPQ